MNAGQTRSERGIGGAERDWQRGAGLAGAGGIYSFRPFGAPPSEREARG